jgi:predicted acyltransferase
LLLRRENYSFHDIVRPDTVAAAFQMNDSIPAASPATAAPARLMSLDVFRGATIAAMMLVNNPGTWDATYAQLDHAEWSGWTFTDLIFPFFLWIVGVAIPLSTSRRIEQGQSRMQLFRHAFRRALIIFALGFFLNSFLYFVDGALWKDGFAAWFHNYATSVRIPGVLQRIAVCYLVTVLIFLRTGVRGQIITTAALLAGYWILMVGGPLLGFGTAGFEKGANFAQYIDEHLLTGPVIGIHVWKAGKTWDPEGIVSTIPAIATCLFGVLTGHWMRTRRSPENKTVWLLVAGNLLLLAAALLHIWLPINKSLWTSTYAVLMAGLAANCFGVFYWLVDVQGWRAWAKPLAIYGMNAITVFVLAGLIGRIGIAIKVTTGAGKTASLQPYLYQKLFAPLAAPKNASLLWAILFMLGLYLVAYLMYRRKWFVKF